MSFLEPAPDTVAPNTASPETVAGDEDLEVKEKLFIDVSKQLPLERRVCFMVGIGSHGDPPNPHEPTCALWPTGLPSTSCSEFIPDARARPAC